MNKELAAEIEAEVLAKEKRWVDTLKNLTPNYDHFDNEKMIDQHIHGHKNREVLGELEGVPVIAVEYEWGRRDADTGSLNDLIYFKNKFYCQLLNTVPALRGGLSQLGHVIDSYSNDKNYTIGVNPGVRFFGIYYGGDSNKTHLRYANLHRDLYLEDFPLVNIPLSEVPEIPVSPDFLLRIRTKVTIPLEDPLDLIISVDTKSDKDTKTTFSIGGFPNRLFKKGFGEMHEVDGNKWGRYEWHPPVPRNKGKELENFLSNILTGTEITEHLSDYERRRGTIYEFPTVLTYSEITEFLKKMGVDPDQNIQVVLRRMPKELRDLIELPETKESWLDPYLKTRFLDDGLKSMGAYLNYIDTWQIIKGK